MSSRSVAGVLVGLLVGLCAACGDSPRGAPWVGAWGTAHGSLDPAFPMADETLRQIARSTVDGGRVRVRLTNALGPAAVRVAAASLARRESGATLVPGTQRGLTFDGRGAVVLAPGEDAWSDPVAFDVRAGQDLAVSLYFEGPAGLSSAHPIAHQTAYVSSTGDHTSAVEFPTHRTASSVFLLTAIDAQPSTATAAVVALGDSITEGFGSTVDANAAWPDRLAERLAGSMGVLNAGISGNQILGSLGPTFGPSALARFDRDVLGHSGVTHVILVEGINDIQLSDARAEDIARGIEELIRRSRRANLTILGGTLPPFGGAFSFRPEREAQRQALNRWIRESADFDAVIDFDALLRDPRSPERLWPAFDTGDHLHLSDTGYRAMGDAVDLSLLLGASR